MAHKLYERDPRVSWQLGWGDAFEWQVPGKPGPKGKDVVPVIVPRALDWIDQHPGGVANMMTKALKLTGKTNEVAVLSRWLKSFAVVLNPDDVPSIAERRLLPLGEAMLEQYRHEIVKVDRFLDVAEGGAVMDRKAFVTRYPNLAGWSASALPGHTVDVDGDVVAVALR